MCISIELEQKIFWARLRIEPTGICILEVQRHRRMFQVEFEKKNLCLYAAIGAIFPSETNGMLFGKNEIPKHVGFDEEWKPLRSFVWSNSGRLIGQRRHHVICDT